MLGPRAQPATSHAAQKPSDLTDRHVVRLLAMGEIGRARYTNSSYARARVTAAAPPKPPPPPPRRPGSSPEPRSSMSPDQKETITMQALGLLNEQVQARIVHYRGELETNAE